MTGYLHLDYAQSLAQFGVPREMPHSRGWILERQIPGVLYRDAMGCYPLFCCQDWSQLHTDLEDIGADIISLALVTDPFGDYDVAHLHRCFNYVVIPFKEHFIVDLCRFMDTFVCEHHRRYARKALREFKVEKCEDPTQFLNEWMELYANLIKRHSISEILAFSGSAFAKQLSVPGIVVFRAEYKQTTAGMLLWYVQGEVGYYHLGAYSNLGYDMRASFALFWFAIDYFAAYGLQWLNLGAGAGVTKNAMDGLSRFKRGWSTGTRTAYFCGHIFENTRYREIMKAKGISATEYFPAYRKGEFE